MKPHTDLSEIRVPVASRYLGRLRFRWKRHRSLSRAMALVPEILRQLSADHYANPPSEWVVHWSQWGRTDAAVMGLGPRSGASLVVVKAVSSEGAIHDLERQSRALRLLHSNPQLGQWRELLPRTVAEGRAAEWHFVVHEALPGVGAHTLAKDPGSRERLQSLAAATIGHLRENTSDVVIGDHSLVDRLVSRPLERIREGTGSKLPVNREQALQRLDSELRSYLTGRTLLTSWVHGDFWLGNLLAAPDSSRLTGIVDWGMSAQHDLPLQDILHLILQMRQVVERRELGDVIKAALSEPGWNQHERSLLDSAGLDIGPGGWELRPVMLLYWLRHLKHVFDQDLGHAQDPYWMAWNVDGVLKCL